ncbi:MAG: FkbM family methyltransferase [Pseudomonadota bacterium]
MTDIANTSAGHIRRWARAALSQSTRRLLRRPVTYGRRLGAWLQVRRNVRGVTAEDASVILRSVIRGPIASLSDIDRWREPELADDATVHVRGLGTFALRRASDDLGHTLPANNAKLFAAISSRVTPGDTVIDAGANIGAVSVFLAKQVGARGRVLAVEMLPATAACLRHNLSLNGLQNVSVIERALADQSGLHVKAEVTEGVFGQARLSHAGDPTERASQIVEVATTTLDELAAEVGQIALIKIDIEGAEPLAFAGGAEMLKRTKAAIFESWRTDGGESARLLRAAGFSIAPIDGRNFIAVRGRVSA